MVNMLESTLEWTHEEVINRVSSGIESYTLWNRVKVDSGIGLPNAHGKNVLESTLEWTKGRLYIIVSSGIGSYTPCFSLDSASECTDQ
jgi:hypothetical protein